MISYQLVIALKVLLRKIKVEEAKRKTRQFTIFVAIMNVIQVGLSITIFSLKGETARAITNSVDEAFLNISLMAVFFC